ncbi:MAG: D-alanyl-D-alanine carboxypeptidase family protein, partial [Spirochaetia bacterium]|nr:D-alanyl-D-alanine carboxypeptidase family protein [Spirochaetia bacterium]
WHYTYLPLSKNLLGLYREEISLPRLTGFAGEGFARELSIIPNYVFGINEAVK